MKTTIAAGIVLATLSSATALASADAAPSPSIHHASSQRAGHSYQVVAKVNKTEPLLNDKVKIKATVTPAAPGAQVTLQLKYADQKKWKTIDHGRLDGRGKVTFKDKVSSVRQRLYRVVKPAGANRGAGQGTTPKVTVFGWRTLDSLTPALSQGMYESGNALINGTTYPSSLGTSVQLGGSHIDYNLNRDCKLLEARYGLDDRSPSGAVASLALTADSVSKYSGNFGLTQSQLVTTDVKNVFRITFTGQAAGGGSAVVASPRVLCSF